MLKEIKRKKFQMTMIFRIISSVIDSVAIEKFYIDLRNRYDCLFWGLPHSIEKINSILCYIFQTYFSNWTEADTPVRKENLVQLWAPSTKMTKMVPLYSLMKKLSLEVCFK